MEYGYMEGAYFIFYFGFGFLQLYICVHATYTHTYTHSAAWKTDVDRKGEDRV